MPAPAAARVLRTGLGLFIAGLLGGCSTLSYYGQAASGQLQLLASRRPVTEVLADPATPEPTRKLLVSSQAIRRYAIERLGLPDNGSYTSYADIGRPNVVWNVTATPEFSLKPIQHCFPVVGCLDYRGFFSKEAADAAAAELGTQGYDTYVSTATAFSSLGWFRDPLLNTMLRWDDVRLAEVMFHELAHQRLYVRDDSAFSEAFATAVQQAGVRQWLRDQGRVGDLAAYGARELRRQQFLELINAYREKLTALYALGIHDPAALREAKAEQIRQLRHDYAHLKSGWGSVDYDAWFAGEINNAKLALAGTYNAGVPAFLELLGSVGDDLPAFYVAATEVSLLNLERRRAWLEHGGSR